MSGLGEWIPFRRKLKELIEAVMRTGPSCPLRLGTFDSPDYWTDTALMSAVRPLTALESSQMTKMSQASMNHLRRRSIDASE